MPYLLPFLTSGPVQLHSSGIQHILTASLQPPSKVSSSRQVAANIRRLLPDLVSKTQVSGYIATLYGKNKDRVYGLAQCRGDIDKKDSKDCMAKQVHKQCPDKADIRIWYSLHSCGKYTKFHDKVGRAIFMTLLVFPYCALID